MPLDRWPGNAATLLQFAGRYDNWLGTSIEMIEARRIQADNREMAAEALENREVYEPITIVTLPAPVWGQTWSGGPPPTLWQKYEGTVVVLSWLATPLALFLVTLSSGLWNIALRPIAEA